VEESIRRNDSARQDAINLTDYQRKELSEVEARQANIIAQFNADTAQINKEIADLRTRRETEVSSATKWNAEEARIENAYKLKMADYANQKAAFQKAKAEYDGANFLKRQLMKEPVSPGVPPEREVNTILKPTLIAELDAQIKAKEAELINVNNKRRERVAQVDADARRLREQFDTRSTTKREESDRKREELAAALSGLAKEGKVEADKIDQEFATAVQKVDTIRAEIDACRKKAEGFYEAREASIRRTQVHRIATTVEIVRGLIKGERPMSIKTTTKERGDILTDQISMVRIWVYPVLAFIVAFLPTLMVEIGFSTVFQPESSRPPHRLGFLGRQMHALYTRAGRWKILRAERLANEATAALAIRDRTLAAAKSASEQALAEKETELQAAREAVSVAAANSAEHGRKKEEEWVAKLAGMADSLNRAIIEKDALRDLQKSEVERQIQMRQIAWQDRLTQLRQELDTQRASGEAERTAMMQEHQQKLLAVTEDCKTQIIQARRQMADAELAAVERSSSLTHELKEALLARDTAEAQLKQQADTSSFRLAQAQEDSARAIEKAARQEKLRLERQQMEFEKTLRQREEDFERRSNQREQEWTAKADARETELRDQWAADVSARQEEWEHQAESRVRAIETRAEQDAQQKDELFANKSRQRDQQWQMKLDALRTGLQAQTQEALRRRDAEAQTALRELETQLREEMRQKEESVQAAAKQREQDLTTQLTAQAEARQIAARAQWETETEKKTRNAIEPLTTMMSRIEKERDEAQLAAAENARQVQDMEIKLSEASSFLNGWRNGKRMPGLA